MLVLVLVPLSIFTALAVPVALGASVPGDEPIYRFLHEHALLPGPMADLLASREIELVGACLIAAVLLGLVFFGRIRATVLLVTALLPLALIPVLKGLFERAAPQSGPTNAGAFPSGHATASMALAAVAVTYTWPTRYRWPALLGVGALVAAVGLAAVIEGGHWPSDVVAGWALALGWVSVVYLAAMRV